MGTLTFNTQMQSGTIENTSFRAFGEVSGKHSGVISYNSGTNTVTLNPDANFVFGEKVQVVLTEDIRTEGNSIPLAGGYSWRFAIAPLLGDGNYELDATNYAVGKDPLALAVGEFNNDVYTDFVVANSAENSVSVFKNNQRGGFDLADTYTVESNPRGLTVADIDADGDMDIIVANNTSNNISVLKNQGNGSFTTVLTYP
ncbi:VCBS repeat-containing protein, partial [candidate division KSB1 bacterium]|nr:VCBS repeat-containing protein [candidate division KSB1 bacterium]